MPELFPRRWLSAVLAASTAVALTIGLSGCGGIPTSGPVRVGEVLSEQGESDVEFLPFGPEAGATQLEILRGFILAFRGPAGDFEVAREFLSREFSGAWNPMSNVTVRSADSGERFPTVDTDTLAYSISAIATIDATGALRQNSAPVNQTLEFDFVQENGEWRISHAADGIVLSDAAFHATFRQHALYFLDPTGDRLVPDLRWYPGGSAALRIVTALLDGPPAWLQGAVRTAFPEGTTLLGPSVDVQSGSATVDLSADAVRAGARDRQLMQLQLQESLSNVATIRRVSITASGTPLRINELGASVPEADPRVDVRAVVLKDGTFGYLAGDEVTPIGQLSARVLETAPRGATLAADAGSAAVLGSAGVSIARANDSPSLVLDARTDLVAPSIDAHDFVWSASASAPGTVRVFDFAGAFVDISTDLPSDARVVSIDVSREGARIAILLAASSGPRIVVKAINRDPNQNQLPISLSESVLDMSWQGGTAIDATWVDNLSVATLSGESGQPSVMLFEVGGERSSLGQPPSAVALVGGNGVPGIRVLGADGTVITRTGNGWTDTRVGVAFLATQQ